MIEEKGLNPEAADKIGAYVKMNGNKSYRFIYFNVCYYNVYYFFEVCCMNTLIICTFEKINYLWQFKNNHNDIFCREEYCIDKSC